MPLAQTIWQASVVAVAFGTFLLGPAHAECSGRPSPTENIGQADDGLLVLKEKFLRPLSKPCYVYPDLFKQTNAAFDLIYYKSMLADDDSPEDLQTLVDFAFVQVIRRTVDRYAAGNVIKIVRPRSWFRVATDKVEAIPAVPDTPIKVSIDQWNSLHSDADQDVVNTDTAFGKRWHGSPDKEGNGGDSWLFHRLMQLPPLDVPAGDRVIVHNLLLRFTSGGSSPLRIPFNATIYGETDELIINYYFGSDPVVRSVRLCKSNC